jgi:hypothetical protein
LAENSTPNPIDTVDLTDLFAKDPDLLTDDELKRIVDYHREQRAKFEAMEAAGGPRKAKAAAKKAATATPGDVTDALDIQVGKG